MAEKSVGAIPRPLREQYEKGKAAFERNNLDYAITLFMSVLQEEPGFYECREALRATQFKRGGKKGLLKKLLGGTHPKIVTAQALVRRNPVEAIRLCEEVLNKDPLQLTAHKVLADAAVEADFPRTAVLSYEIILKHDPENKEVAMKLARVLGRLGQWGRAEELLQAMVQKYPEDMALNDLLKEVSAQRTLQEGGYEQLGQEESSYRQVLKDEKEAQILEKEERHYRDADTQAQLLAEYEARLEKEPQNLRLLRAIAELYAERKEYDRALEYYRRIQQTEAKDPTIEKAIADIYARKFDEELQQLDPSAPDYEQRKQEILQRKQQFLLEDAGQRVARYPNDPRLHFEYGQLLFEAGRLREAIQHFQKAQASLHLKTRALYWLARCFEQRRMYDLAARSLLNALKEKTEFDEEKKELLYTLGCVYEKMGRQEEAIEQFKAIYEVDIGYRDVADRVDAYYMEKESSSSSSTETGPSSSAASPPNEEDRPPA